jgi:microcystin-dependent protein
MGQPYIGEVRIFAGNFAPAGWAFCNGQLLPISENDTLFNLIGTTYGGDGQETFALPDLQGRIPINTSSSHPLAESGGAESVTLSTQQMPAHPHPFVASTDFAGQSSPTGNVLAQLQTAGSFIYVAGAAALALAPNSVLPAGSSQPHDNIQPYQCISYIISLFGIFPSQN